MKNECASMKKYSIGLFALFLGCVALIGAAYQFSFEYSKNQAKEEARLKQEIVQAAREEEAAIAAEGDVSKEEVFYLKDLNGFIAVYKSDKKTIYEYTNIVVEDLPEDVRQEILDGKEIRTVEKLYGFLENYSS